MRWEMVLGTTSGPAPPRRIDRALSERQSTAKASGRRRVSASASSNSAVCANYTNAEIYVYSRGPSRPTQDSLRVMRGASPGLRVMHRASPEGNEAYENLSEEANPVGLREIQYGSNTFLFIDRPRSRLEQEVAEADCDNRRGLRGKPQSERLPLVSASRGPGQVRFKTKGDPRVREVTDCI